MATAALMLLGAVGGCGGGSSMYGRCLTEADVCQFTIGVSTQQQVKVALGSPQISQSISSGGQVITQWVYACQPDPQSVEQVQFIFDGNGVLMERLALSSGPNAPPAPTCAQP
jgi:outer membrane protein assembly factor BamE (lipoprotein component of BamABCDE complex)